MLPRQTGLQHIHMGTGAHAVLHRAAARRHRDRRVLQTGRWLCRDVPATARVSLCCLSADSRTSVAGNSADQSIPRATSDLSRVLIVEMRASLGPLHALLAILHPTEEADRRRRR